MTQEEFNKMLCNAIDEGILTIKESINNADNPYAERVRYWFKDTDYVIVHN